MRLRRIVFEGDRRTCRDVAEVLRADALYAVARFEPGLGWHVTVTPWA